MATTTTATMTTKPAHTAADKALATMHIVDLSTETDPDLVSPSVCRVRFDSECVLIPDPISPSRMPRLLQKSYSLPLWRKKPPTASTSAPAAETPISPNDDGRARFAFARKDSKSRGRSTSRDPNDPTRTVLVPCMVDHDHPHPRRFRRPSLPIAPKLDVITVPLQDCCLKCHRVLEDSLIEGCAWQEKFSKGARRRRNSSADDLRPVHRRVDKEIPGFEAILNVDEVDKRRRSREAESPQPMEVINLDEDEQGATEGELGLLPSLTRQKLHIATDNPVSKTPLVEEDEEDQLFPLPSPRRTPNGSPLPSPLATPSSSTTNLAKTLLGQKASQNASSGSPVLPQGRQSPSLPPPYSSSPRLLAVPPTHQLEASVSTSSSTTSSRMGGRETIARFETSEILASFSSVDAVPELTRSPSLFGGSPDLSLPSPSPTVSPRLMHSQPIAIHAQRTTYTTSSPVINASPVSSPQMGSSPSQTRGHHAASASTSSSSGLSLSPTQGWRKISMGAGSILRAGADVLKGVNNMGGGVVV